MLPIDRGIRSCPVLTAYDITSLIPAGVETMHNLSPQPHCEAPAHVGTSERSRTFCRESGSSVQAVALMLSIRICVEAFSYPTAAK